MISELRDHQANKAAAFLPGAQTRGDDALPAVEIAGAQVYAYVKDGILRVSVDLDTVSTSDYWPQSDEMIIPVRVCVQGATVYEADAQGRETCGCTPAPTGAVERRYLRTDARKYYETVITVTPGPDSGSARVYERSGEGTGGPVFYGPAELADKYARDRDADMTSRGLVRVADVRN